MHSLKSLDIQQRNSLTSHGASQNTRTQISDSARSTPQSPRSLTRTGTDPHRLQTCTTLASLIRKDHAPALLTPDSRHRQRSTQRLRALLHPPPLLPPSSSSSSSSSPSSRRDER
eukprot:2625608-Rhodomonas_salina.2